jgi:hypothetical protein
MIEIKCSYTEMRDIETIVPHPRNPNTHPAEQIKRLAKIIEHTGFRSPIVISKRSGFVIKGHGRLMAAKALQMDAVPVDIQDYTDEAQEWSDMIADNRIAELSEIDNSLLIDLLNDIPDPEFTGFTDVEIGELFETIEPEQQETTGDDDVLTDAPARTVFGDIYQLGNHRLMCGDSNSIDSIDSLIDGNIPDAIITDPPYGIGIDGQKESKSSNPKHNRKAHDFRGWDNERPDIGIFNYIVGVNIPSVIWGGNYFADLLPATRGWIYWGKGQDGLTMSDGELAWTSECKPLRCITINRATLHGSVHPTQKPVKVIEFSIDYINAGKYILDLFGGSGSTLIACEKKDRNSMIMEIDTKYCDVIVNRYINFCKDNNREWSVILNGTDITSEF